MAPIGHDFPVLYRCVGELLFCVAPGGARYANLLAAPPLRAAYL
jgi:hypothetical protein